MIITKIVLNIIVAIISCGICSAVILSYIEDKENNYLKDGDSLIIDILGCLMILAIDAIITIKIWQ